MEDNIQSYRTRFFNEYDIFPDDFINKCKDNATEYINIPIEVRNNIK